MKFGAAAQGLTGALVRRRPSCVMHQDDGDAVSALEFAQVGEQRRDLAGGVLVDAVQADEGVEDEQAGPQLRDGFLEAGAVGGEVEAQRRAR